MRSLHLAVSLPFALALAACGPTASPLDDSGGGSSGGTSSGTTGPGQPTTSGPMTEPTTATSATPTGDELSTSAGDSESMGFLAGPDGGVCGPESEFRCSQCDPFAQDCPDASKCSPFATDGTPAWTDLKCVPITGDGLAGEPCTTLDNPGSGLDDCALGHACWDLDDQLHGECVALCAGDPQRPVCGPGSVCVVSGDGVAALCIPTCDPLVQDCDADEVCIFSNFGFVCSPEIDSPGGLNDPCQFANECDSGLVCIEAKIASSECAPDSDCCAPFCSFPGGACPNPDQTCIAWWDPGQAPPGEEDIGVCAAQ